MTKTYQRSALRRCIGRILGYEQEIRELREEIRELQWDSPFGMWTRNAFLNICNMMPRGRRVVAFIDLDDIHDLNHEVGYAEVDRRIRSTFSIQLRSSDLVARWYSGDEIVVLFDSDKTGARKKIGELQDSAQSNGLGFVWELGEWEVGRQDVADVVNALADSSRKRLKQRKERQHGSRT